MSIEKEIGTWIERYESNGYLNGALLIAIKDRIIVNKGFGMANFEHQVRNLSTTRFRIGSLTKAFTAFAIFQLHENGKLNINDCIRKYIPDYPRGEEITIYHCLTNTSGIPNYTSFPDFWSTTMRLPSTLDQLIDSFKVLELSFEPGTRFEYSNSGYALLTAIIEKVSNMSYGEYIKDKICRPLGMTNTGCDDGIKVIPNLATGYSFWEEPIHPAYTDLSFPLGAYGLYSTTEDLFIWDKALKSANLITNEHTEKMFTPNLGLYACGWMVSEILNRKCFHHFGDISGYYNDFLRFVDDQVTIIFLSNMAITPVIHLTQELAKIIFEGEVSVPLPMERIIVPNLERLAGKYVTKDHNNMTLDVSMNKGELYLTVPKMYGVHNKFKLVPVSQNTSQVILLTEMINEQLIFNFSESGEIESVEYKDFYDERYIAVNGN